MLLVPLIGNFKKIAIDQGANAVVGFKISVFVDNGFYRREATGTAIHYEREQELVLNLTPDVKRN